MDWKLAVAALLAVELYCTYVHWSERERAGRGYQRDAQASLSVSGRCAYVLRRERNRPLACHKVNTLTQDLRDT